MEKSLRVDDDPGRHAPVDGDLGSLDIEDEAVAGAAHDRDPSASQEPEPGEEPLGLLPTGDPGNCRPLAHPAHGDGALGGSGAGRSLAHDFRKC